jgi:hypothetical protein
MRMSRRIWLVLAIIALVATSFAASVVAARRSSEHRNSHITRGLDYLHVRQTTGGGFGSPDATSWAILGAVATGERMGNSAWSVKGKNPFEYLQGSDLASAATTVANAPEYYSRVIMAYVAVHKKTQTGTAGSKGINLFDYLWSYQDWSDTSPDKGAFSPVKGTLTDAISTTAWAILAMHSMDALDDKDRYLLAREWLSKQQATDGGFALNPSAESSVKDSALVIQALKVGPDLSANWSEADARQFLKDNQLNSGGFRQSGQGNVTNTDATSSAIQAIKALGEDPDTWKSATGKTPLGALRALQQTTGAYKSTAHLRERALPVTSWALIAQSKLPFTKYPKTIPGAVKAFKFRPQFRVVSPKNGAKFKTHIVLIRATYTDFWPKGTGIKPSACRLYVDTANRSKAADIGKYGLHLQLKNVPNGDHTFKIELRDHAGNARIIEHKFSVAVPTPTPTSTPTPQPTLNPGPVYPTYTPQPSHTTATPTPTPYPTLTPYPYSPSPGVSPIVTGSPVSSPSASASPAGAGAEGGGGSAAGFVGGTLLAMLPIGAVISYLALHRREDILGGASQGSVLAGGGSSWERFKQTLAKSKDLTKPSSRG